MTTLYTGRVSVRGGRNGAVRSDDGRLDAPLAFPKALGGTGEGTNPEQLFGAGYAACFATTLEVIAKSEGKALTGVNVVAEVDMLLENNRYDLAVRLLVNADTDRATLEALVEKARGACPYSRATRNTLATTVRVGA
jgi:osmotically inducible protein OsmC